MWCSLFFFSSRRRHTRYIGDWSSDVCSSDLLLEQRVQRHGAVFSAAPAEEDGFRCRQENLQMVWHLLGRGAPVLHLRSEERRVGKECRARRATSDEEKKMRQTGKDRASERHW